MSHISVKKKSGSDFPKLKQERRARARCACGGIEQWEREARSDGVSWIRFYSEARYSTLNCLKCIFISKRGCVNIAPGAIGGQEAGFMQPLREK